MAVRSVAKRFFFAAVAVVVGLGLLEASARLYAVARYRNAAALSHGLKFMDVVRQGTVAFQDEYPFADVQEQSNAAEWTYVNRRADDPDVHLPATGAGDTVVANVPIHFNRYGFRDIEFDPRPPPARTRAVVLGGSFVFGWGLADEEAWPRQLDRKLNIEGRPYEVINAGVVGANINNILTLLVRLLNTIGVHEVVIASSYNDHRLLHVERRYPLATRLDFYMYNLSWLYVMGKERLSVMARQPIDYGLYRQKVHVDGAAVDAWVALYRQRLTQVADLCREHGVRLVLLAEPEMFFDNAYNAKSLLDDRELGAVDAKIRAGDDPWRMELEYYAQGRLDREMQRFGQERAIPFYDAAGLFPADREKFFIDQIHPNGIGAEKIAEGLAEFMRALPPAPLSTAVDEGEPARAPAPATEYAGQMREMYEIVKRLRENVAQKDFDASAADASRLEALFRASESFWAARPDAGSASKAAILGSEQARALVKAATEKNGAGLLGAETAINSTCKTCHDVHRTKFPDGRSAVR